MLLNGPQLKRGEQPDCDLPVVVSGAIGLKIAVDLPDAPGWSRYLRPETRQLPVDRNTSTLPDRLGYHFQACAWGDFVLSSFRSHRSNNFAASRFQI